MDELYIIFDEGLNRSLPPEIKRQIQSGALKAGLLNDKPEDASVLIWDPTEAPRYEALRRKLRDQGVRQRRWYYRQATGYLVVCF